MTKKSRIRPDTFRLMRFSREDVKIADFPIAGIVFTKNLFIINSFVIGNGNMNTIKKHEKMGNYDTECFSRCFS